MSNTPTCVALIPARTGSKRIKNKNIQVLAGHPLIGYTISAALQTRLFDDVIVSTNSEDIADISKYYGASIPFLRPHEFAADLSPDIEWIDYTLKRLSQEGKKYDCFSILRPTSPFRQSKTIARAWNEFKSNPTADSIRAVESCAQHPGKMWKIENNFLKPVLGERPGGVPWHSTPYQDLPPVFAQNASLEIAWTRVVLEDHSISGKKIIPFLTEGYEGLDINTPKDFWYVNYLIQKDSALLPEIKTTPFSKEKIHSLGRNR